MGSELGKKDRQIPREIGIQNLAFFILSTPPMKYF